MIDLEDEMLHFKGQMMFPLHVWSNSASRGHWKVNEETMSLEVHLEAISLGLTNGTQGNRELRYFQAPPHTSTDGRLNPAVPRFGTALSLMPFCLASYDLVPADYWFLWQPLETICPPSMQEEFNKLLIAGQYKYLVNGVTTSDIKKAEFVSVATDYITCGSKWLSSRVKYSHGYDLLESFVWMHFLLEIWPSAAVGYL